MNVPFLDLRAASLELAEEIQEAVAAVITSGRYILGPQLEAFEAEYANATDSTYCVGVGNGLDAIELALRAIGVGAGDDVIAPTNTFIATWLAISRTGARIVPVEPIEGTCNLDPEGVAAALTPATKAVIAVHLYGQPADMKSLKELTSATGIALVEDAAQAHGARAHGRPVGSWGDAAAWSFYPGKNLGAVGDAGAVTTSRPDIARRLRKLRNYGSEAKYVHVERGFNSRLDEVQAAVLRVKLRHLPEWNDRRRHIADLYIRELASAPVTVQEVPPWAEPVWHLFVIRSAQRDALQAHLTARGIETLIHYPIPPHQQHAYAEFSARSFPISERIHQTALSLPIGPHLSREEAGYVARSVHELYQD